MKIETLFRECFLCARDDDQYNQMIAEGVIRRLGLEEDYVEWLKQNRSVRRTRPFQKDKILAMLDG